MNELLLLDHWKKKTVIYTLEIQTWITHAHDQYHTCVVSFSLALE